MTIRKVIPALLLCAGVSVALAQNAPPGGAGRGMRMDPAERFRQLDKNGDGKLSLEEFQAMRMGMGMGMGRGRDGAPPPGAGNGPRGMGMDLAARFKSADTNGDGFLSKEEFAATMPMRRGPGGPGAAQGASSSAPPHQH